MKLVRVHSASDCEDIALLTVVVEPQQMFVSMPL